MVAIWLSESEAGEWPPGEGASADVRRATLTVAETAVSSVSRPWVTMDRATRVRRRRLLVLVGASLCLLSAALATALPGLARTGRSGGGVETGVPPRVVYVVQPGDDLWSIATRLAPDRDPRRMVDALRDANGGDDALDVGDRLVIDRG